MKNLVVAITILAAAGIAGATVTPSYSSQPMAGGTAWDITLSSDCDWTNGRISLELRQGALIDPHAFNFHYSGMNDQDTWVDAAAASDMSTCVIVNTLDPGEVLDWSWYDTTNDGAQTWLAARIIVTNNARLGVLRLWLFDVSAPGEAQYYEYRPEPTTLALLSFGAWPLLRRRR